MRPYTAYALVGMNTRNGRDELALTDARLPIYWLRRVADDVNRERFYGRCQVVPVTIRKRSKKQARQKAKAA